MEMRNQKFGVEIEMTGITRKDAAEAMAEYFGSRAVHVGGGYDAWEIRDGENRKWKVMFDSSITEIVNNKVRHSGTAARGAFKTEMVTPPLEYKDIEKLQEIVRILRKRGAKVNQSCGLHIHIDGANHTAKSLRNAINIMASKEDMLYRALNLDFTRYGRWAKKVNPSIIEKVNKVKPSTLNEMADVWYSQTSDSRSSHYNDSRYHGLNLHNIWYRGTLEFRLFNATLHAGEVKSYIQLCLAISAQAINQRSANPKKTVSDNEAFTFRTWLLRLGLNGEEFKTARTHLLKHLEGDKAWRYGQAQ